MIDIFGIPLFSDVVITRALSVFSVVAACIDLGDFVVTIRVLNFNVTGFGPSDQAMRTVELDFVGLIANVGIVRTVFGLIGVVVVFITGFGVGNVTLVHFIGFIGSFDGTVLVGIIVVVELVEFVINQLLVVVGIGGVDFKIDFVVVKFKFTVEILIGVNVTFDERAGIVAAFGVVAFVKRNVTTEVLNVVEAVTGLGVVDNIVDVIRLELCVP